MFWFDKSRKLSLPTPAEAMKGRSTPVDVPERHEVLGSAMKGPWPGMEVVQFAMGCFWGVERIFWQAEGVVSTAVGYAGGHTPNASYQEVCTGGTGHTEVVQVVYDPTKTTFMALLKLFWEGHDPTQGMRQGNDVGTQYRSAIYTYSKAQYDAAVSTCEAYQERLTAAGKGEITTEIREAPEFYYAEDYHQQYLHKNPGGYCGIGGTGVSCPIGTGA